MIEEQRSRKQEDRQPAELVQIRIARAEDIPRMHSPDNYRPMMQPGPAVHDDEIGQLEGLGPWQQYLAGGSNRPHWIAADSLGNACFITCEGLNGNYLAYGPGTEPDPLGLCDQRFDNAYDAFWSVDQLRGYSPPETTAAGR